MGIEKPINKKRISKTQIVSVIKKEVIRIKKARIKTKAIIREEKKITIVTKIEKESGRLPKEKIIRRVAS